jgi:hypothetical protein
MSNDEMFTESHMTIHSGFANGESFSHEAFKFLKVDVEKDFQLNDRGLKSDNVDMIRDIINEEHEVHDENCKGRVSHLQSVHDNEQAVHITVRSCRTSIGVGVSTDRYSSGSEKGHEAMCYMILLSGPIDGYVSGRSYVRENYYNETYTILETSGALFLSRLASHFTSMVIERHNDVKHKYTDIFSNVLQGFNPEVLQPLIYTALVDSMSRWETIDLRDDDRKFLDKFKKPE